MEEEVVLITITVLKEKVEICILVTFKFKYALTHSLPMMHICVMQNAPWKKFIKINRCFKTPDKDT